MSQAFVKEEDEHWLNDVAPTMQAFVNYHTRQNNGIRVYEIRSHIHPGNVMYCIIRATAWSMVNSEGKWEFIP
ncbi:MAG: hypothetical protein ABIW38_05045 [Ferruginibacter sp.]